MDPQLLSIHYRDPLWIAIAFLCGLAIRMVGLPPLKSDYEGRLVGVEIDQDKAAQHRASRRNVVSGDATNPDFWTRAPELLDGLEWVLLTLPRHKANMNAALRLKEMGYRGRIAATTKYRDEEDALKAIGVERTFNIYTEAGLGFANELQTFVGK